MTILYPTTGGALVKGFELKGMKLDEMLNITEEQNP